MDQKGIDLAAQLRQWGLRLRTYRYAKGDLIFTPDDSAEHLFFVRTGCLRLYRQGHDGKEMVVRWCGQRDAFGEEALTERVYCSFAHAITDVEVEQVSAAALRHVCQRVPQAFEALLQVFATNCRQAAEMAALMQEETPIRLAKALSWLTAQIGEPDQAGWVVLPLTHAQLAALVGAPRECVTVTLRAFQAHRLVEGLRGRLRVNLKALEASLTAPHRSDAPAFVRSLTHKAVSVP